MFIVTYILVIIYYNEVKILKYNDNNLSNLKNNDNYLALYDANEMLKDLPIVLNQMKNIIISNNHSLSILQGEIANLKLEQDKFKKNITRALNIINDKFNTIDDLEESLIILEQILSKKIYNLQDEVTLSQQVAAKSLNEVLKFNDLFKI